MLFCPDQWSCEVKYTLDTSIAGFHTVPVYDDRGAVPLAARVTVAGNRYDVIAPEGTSPEAWLGEATWILDPVDIIDISETLLRDTGGSQRYRTK